MPSTEAAEAMVKVYSEKPAKIEDTELTISMMTTPIDLKYTVGTNTIFFFFLNKKIKMNFIFYRC